MDSELIETLCVWNVFHQVTVLLLPRFKVETMIALDADFCQFWRVTQFLDICFQNVLSIKQISLGK